MEERHAPTQLILGAHDPDFCTLLSVGIYLEHMYPPAEGVTDGELNCFAILPTPPASKARALRLLRSAFESSEFKKQFGSKALSNLPLTWVSLFVEGGCNPCTEEWLQSGRN